MKSKIRILGIVVLVIAAVLLFWLNSKTELDPQVKNEAETLDEAANDSTSNDSTRIEDISVEPSGHSIDEIDSLWLVVNRDRPISLDYVPENIRLVDVTSRTDKGDDERSMRDDAATALESLFAAAEAENIFLLLGSGYRDADLQATYYNSYVAAEGQAEADKYSAKPGTSEHQTGLVADVSPEDRNCYLSTCFADTPEGIWVRDNAHNYGFVIRYPEGKESITGYQFEPWHLRFVGDELAADLFGTGQTLEEYFELI